MNMKEMLVVIAAFILIATNPSLERHQARVSEVAASCYAEDMGVIGRFIQLHTVAGATIGPLVTRVNLVVCSIGMIDNTPVSLGALNCVLVRTDWE